MSSTSNVKSRLASPPTTVFEIVRLALLTSTETGFVETAGRSPTLTVAVLSTLAAAFSPTLAEKLTEPDAPGATSAMVHVSTQCPSCCETSAPETLPETGSRPTSSTSVTVTSACSSPSFL